jgi:nicotinamide-nucleotide amidase
MSAANPEATAVPTAVVISIGEELLEGRIADTNSGTFARELLLQGLHVTKMYTVGDGIGELQALLTQLADHVDVILTTGGLGPTTDDRTRDDVAASLGVPVIPIPVDGAVEHLSVVYKKYHDHPATEAFLAQASMPAGAEPLHNSVGSAWGFMVNLGTRTRLYCLPGPPVECLSTYRDGGASADMKERFQAGASLAHGVLHTAGAPESVVEEHLRELFVDGGNPRLGITANADKVSISVLARSELAHEPAEHLLETTLQDLQQRLGTLWWGRDAQTMASIAVESLQKAGQTVAVAESCTGGRLAAAITGVAGASQVFSHGWVTYSDQAKQQQLGVPKELVVEYGAVSVEVATAMADGARRVSGSDWALAITGIAGPGGGTEEKPVGTVCLAISGPEGSYSLRRLQFARAGRDAIQRQSVRDALDMLRRGMNGLPPLG